ncbi:MAG: hypothetical protein HZB56_05875 [Deltaproteobacteria bacterium]|nr:hypothetical protein [Deltaproteobacteria bacterium]
MRTAQNLTLLRGDAAWPGRRAGPQDPADLWIALSAVVIGAIPFAGYTLRGRWDERELGVASLLLILGLRGVALALFRRPG